MTAMLMEPTHAVSSCPELKTSCNSTTRGETENGVPGEIIKRRNKYPATAKLLKPSTLSFLWIML